MNTIKMLALREWMQHGRAWLLLAAVPLAVALVAVLFGRIEFDDIEQGGGVTASMAYYLLGGGYLVGMGVLAASVAAIQWAGLARRDVQDRSIEFWLSLPVDHWRAVLVPMVMLLVGMPLLVMAVSLLAAPLLGTLGALRLLGVGSLGEMGWAGYVAAWAALGLRMSVGIVVGALWLAPVVALGMAVSAWFKRWGAVIFLVGVFGGVGILAKLYGIEGPQRALFELLGRAVDGYVMVGGPHTLPGLSELAAGGFFPVARALLADVSRLLGDMVSLLFVAGLGVAALGVWLQVLRRQRG